MPNFTTLSASSPDILASLFEGGPGTGKSLVTAITIDNLVEREINPVIIAHTHKALRVLMAKVKNQMSETFTLDVKEAEKQRRWQQAKRTILLKVPTTKDFENEYVWFDDAIRKCNDFLYNQTQFNRKLIDPDSMKQIRFLYGKLAGT